LFEKLVEIGKIPLAFAGVYGALDEAKLRVGEGVMDAMFRAPGNEFASGWSTLAPSWVAYPFSEKGGPLFSVVAEL